MTEKRAFQNFKSVALTLTTAVLLAACQSTQGVDSNNGKIDGALNRAAHKAAANGDSDQSLAYLEKIYKRNSEDEQATVNFAAALRKSGDNLRAATILAPFANKKDGSSFVKSEFAAIRLAQGNFTSAEAYARGAIKADETNYEAYQSLGIAMDGQKDHKSAEEAFRKALDLWQGDPTTIMNNLALNLAAQEKLDEAEEILIKAKGLSPNRIELERNLRMVRALKESSSYTYKNKDEKTAGDTPKPASKPKS
jgi:Flp pilus assembly protein TadD